VTELLKEIRQARRQARRLPPPDLAKAIRAAAGVSQQRLADELGVHRVSVARWELGQRRPRGRLLHAYADLLDALQREAQ
jgi:transcriptional regulator with XRE-family HTH domain